MNGTVNGAGAAFRYLVLATAVGAYLLVLLGGYAGASGHYRLGAAVVVLLALATAVAALRTRKHRRPILLGTAIAIGLLAAQVGLSGLTGFFQSPPSVVAAHLGTAMAFFATLLVLGVIAGAGVPLRRPQAAFSAPWALPVAAAAATYVVILLGGYVKSSGAGPACPDWPLCQGEWIPSLRGAVLVHFLHRLAVLVAGGAVALTAFVAWRFHRHRPAILTAAAVAVGLYLTQVLLGALVVFRLLPPALTIAHLAGAWALFATLVVLAALAFHSTPLVRVAGGAVATAAVPRMAAADAPAVARAGGWRDYLALSKPRIILLLLITGYTGMWMASGGPPPPRLAFWTLLGLAMSSAAANALNMVIDRDIDAVMTRTRHRPLPAGRLRPRQALLFGIAGALLSFGVLWERVNLLSAALSTAGLLFYVFVYTLWLKRRSAQNIVIGGAAGAVPPLVGWAAVTGGLSWAAAIMFLIVFLWTPPHFWALALFRSDDYRRAGVPMLPIVRGEAETKRQIFLYTSALVPATLLLYPLGAAGAAYLSAALALGGGFVAAAVALWRDRGADHRRARLVFGYSLVYLALLCLAMALDATA